jgi:hypothetical protein
VGHGGIGGAADKACVPGHDSTKKGTHVVQRPQAPLNVNGNAKEEWNKDENRSKSSNVGIQGVVFDFVCSIAGWMHPRVMGILVPV